MERPLTQVPAPWRSRGRDRRTWLCLGGIAVLAVVLRLVVVLSLHPTCDPVAPEDGCFRVGADSFYYSEQGRLLAEGHLFANPNGLFDGTPPDQLDEGGQHPPLFPVVLGLVSLGGFETSNDHRVFTAVLGGLGTAIVAAVAWRVAGRRAAVAAGALAAVTPALWLNDDVLMSESLFAVLVAATLLAAFALWERPSVKRAAVLGLFIGLATLTRTEGIGLVVLLAAPILLVSRSLTNRERLQALGACAGVVFLMLAPWVGFNLSRFQETTLLTSGTGITILAGNCDGAYEGQFIGTSNGSCLDTFFAELDDRPPDVAEAEDESVVDLRARKDGMSYLGDHLGRLPVVVAARVARTWGLYEPSTDRRTDGFIEQRYGHGVDAGYYLYLAMIPTSVAGLLLLRRSGVTIIPFIAMAATSTLLAATTFGLPRFRISADVCMVILTAVTVDAAIAAASRARQRRADPG